jgi:hypothetical protein
MARVSTWPVAAIVAGAIVFTASACSLVSGWSDLQGGGAGQGKDAAPRDGAANDGSSSGDPGDDGSVPGAGVRCGNTRCSGAQGCCFPPPGGGGNGAFCTSEATCQAMTGAFMLCDGRGSCSGATPECCFDFGDFRGQCSATCGPGVETVCNPMDVPACTTGACTDTVPGYGQIPSCQ